jgi:hypothetical protein
LFRAAETENNISGFSAGASYGGNSMKKNTMKNLVQVMSAYGEYVNYLNA